MSVCLNRAYHILALGLLGAHLSLSGCAVVQVKPIASSVSLIEQRESILTRNRLSEASVSVLAMTGQDQDSCTQDLNRCLERLRKVPQISKEQYLSTTSELFFNQASNFRAQFQHCVNDLNAPPAVQQVTVALRSTDQTPEQIAQRAKAQAQYAQQCHLLESQALLDSIRYAYAYLAFSDRPATARLFDNRQVQVRDFYNAAVSRLISQNFQRQREQAHLNQPISVNDQRLHINLRSRSLQGIPAPQELVSADSLGFSGLRSINRRDGFGVEFVAILPDQDVSKIPQRNASIHQSHFLPISIVLKFRGDSLNSVLGSRDVDVDIYNPYDDDHVSLNGTDRNGLAANFSAPYGLWLARTDLAKTAYRSLLGIEQQQPDPQLYMLEPYNPNKRVILLIHGLASSPEAWISLTNDVLGDPILRQHYQVWQVFYPTNMPILESRYLINTLVKQAYDQVDPTHRAPASHNSVLIGHSMGAVIGRLLVSPTDLSQPALQQLNRKDQQRLRNIPLIKQRFVMQPLPSISRAVFVSAPFAGTDFADRWFTRAVRRIVRLPVSFVQGIDTALTRARLDTDLMDRVGQAGLLSFENGPSELSRQSTFMKLTQNVQIKANLPYHLIMGQQNPNLPMREGSDGIVPYSSSHLDGAISEKVIIGGHSIQDTPEAVIEIRRVLRQHLEAIGDVAPDVPLTPLTIHVGNQGNISAPVAAAP